MTNRALNRAVLARQLLLERQPLAVDEAIHRVGGLQGQSPMWPFVGLWSRLAGFDRQALLDGLYERRVVKATLMRGTLHLVTAADYLAVYPGLWPHFQTYAARYRPDRAKFEGLTDLAASAMAFAAQPRPATEIRAHLVPRSPGIDALDVWWRVRFHSPFLHAPVPSATWGFDTRNHIVSAPAWLGADVDNDEGAASIGVRSLVELHLGAFGPAAAADIVRWSGLPVGTVRSAIAAVEPELVRYRDDEGGELLDLAGAPLPDPDTPAPVRLLPMWDSVLLAYADGSRVITPERRRAVVNRRGDVAPTFLVDGTVAGTWAVKIGKKDVTARVQPFGRLAKAARGELAAEAERLVALCAPDAIRRRVTVD